MYVDKLTIRYDNDIEVTEADEERLVLRQRFDAGRWGSKIILRPDELGEIVALAKFLGWDI